MKIRKLFQKLLYRTCEAAFYFFYTLLKALSPSVFSKVAYPFLWLFVSLVIPKRRVVKNLSAAFGESYSLATKKGLARGVQEQFIQNLLDCFGQISDHEHARRTITIAGMEYLQSALQGGKGVIALGAHIGNFVLLGTRVGLEGHRFHTLFRIPDDRRIKKAIARYLPHYHQSVIPSLPRRAAVRSILAALKRNEIVYILGDNLKKGRIEALLFGQRVPSPRGPVSLALRSGAPLVPMYLVRQYHGAMELVIEPEVEMVRNGALANDIAENTQRVVLYLESLIRRYPDQWNWLTVRMTNYQERSVQHGENCLTELTLVGGKGEAGKTNRGL
jgi:Kdo2-lipid IVA lauroyltransferase/acyltransferase